jgi:hypothetical protein
MRAGRSRRPAFPRHIPPSADTTPPHTTPHDTTPRPPRPPAAQPAAAAPLAGAGGAAAGDPFPANQRAPWKPLTPEDLCSNPIPAEALKLKPGYHWYETMIVLRPTVSDLER